MASAGCIVHRCLVIANAMDAKSNHGIRLGAWGIAVVAFGEILFPLAGRIPAATEGWLVIFMGLYFAAEKRRPIYRREREQQGVPT
jgi:hypothetical protein